MKGQWLGTYTGSSNGTIMVNIDEHESNYEGTAYLTDQNSADFIPSASFRTENKNSTFRFRTKSITPLSPFGLIVHWDAVQKKFPNHSFPKYADVTGSCDENSLTLSWTTDIGSHGKCLLPCSKAAIPSELVAIEKNWDTYKQHVSDLNAKQPIFRGQDGIWRLQTSFHRSGRADLARFIEQDVPILYRHLSARTKHFFNINVPDENGAFLNLVRHHGYPTPLLDWTYSPFVAAFFAFRKISKKDALDAPPDKKVRIHVFDRAQWCEDCFQILFVAPPSPHVSVCEFIAIENERMIPQQAVSTATNIDDIENYIRSMEMKNNKTYLSAIDLPVSERERVLRDLSYMGITAGSLFPGLDGACEELKERNF